MARCFHWKSHTTITYTWPLCAPIFALDDFTDRLFLVSHFSFLSTSRIVCRMLSTVIIIHSSVNATRTKSEPIAVVADRKRTNSDATDYSRRFDCVLWCLASGSFAILEKNEFSHQALVFVYSVLMSYAATKRLRRWLEVHLGVVQLMLAIKHMSDSISHKQIQIRRQKKLLAIKNYASWKRFWSWVAQVMAHWHTRRYIEDMPAKRSHFQLIKKMRIVVKGKCMPHIECEECE